MKTLAGLTTFALLTACTLAAPRSTGARSRGQDSFSGVRGARGRLTQSPTAAQPSAGAPLSLTASDGTGLQLVFLRAKAVVEGPLAFTELHLAFRNPEARRREGRFSITLPTGAAISRSRAPSSSRPCS